VLILDINQKRQTDFINPVAKKCPESTKF